MSGAARFWSFVAVVFVIAGALALFVSPFASSSPDGLESVARAQGVEASSAAAVWHFSPLGDYRLPGIESEGLSTALAGLIGVVALFGLVIGAGWLLGRGRMEPG